MLRARRDEVISGADRLLNELQAEVAAVTEGERIALVFAHPDDETIAVGGQLTRLREALLIVVTDGAPRTLDDASRHGFPDAEHYAAARRAELNRALHLAEYDPQRVVHLGIPDQTAAHAMVDIARRLADVFAQCATRIVITHAYEGGHPDHDACAFAAHMAARLLAPQRIEIIEVPFYRGRAGAMATQTFGEDASNVIELTLSRDDRERKVRMLQAHATQAQVLANFEVGTERFRRAASYDFATLPNGGDLLYERFGWMSGADWTALARDARDQLQRLC